ncbi:MAG: hypothetical protein ACTSPW_06420 [Promethearchaeota archaeon]
MNNLKEYPKNGRLFKDYVIGARFNRGKSIPLKNIISFEVSKNPLYVNATLLSSFESNYIVYIFRDDKTKEITIVHNCPDFRNGYDFCKHIVRILLLVEPHVCAEICKDINNIRFTSNTKLIKKSQENTYNKKAEKLLSENKIEEAIVMLGNAYEKSGKSEYMKKILEICKKKKSHRLLIKYLSLNEDYSILIEYKDEIANYINEIFAKYNNYNLQGKIEITFDILNFFRKFSEEELKEILNEINFTKIDPLYLRFLMLKDFNKNIRIGKFFRKSAKSKIPPINTIKLNVKKELKRDIENSIINLDPLELFKNYKKIIDELELKNKTLLINRIKDYEVKLKKRYKEGLKLKHAFLRSLVIENYGTDKLTPLSFTTNYKFKDLVWTRVPKKESPLYYYILEKCGFERHQLQYMTKKYFIENYPVFRCIFNSNNPLYNAIQDFWGKSEPKIENNFFTKQYSEIGIKLKNLDLEKFILIEWDLVKTPILGSHIYQIKEGYIIPDFSQILTYELQPFDLTICLKKPIAIKSENVRILKPIMKVSVENAINLIYKGMDFIASYLPFSVILDLKNQKIDELKAWEIINEKSEQLFSPKKDAFRKHFKNFIQKLINEDFNDFYQKLLKNEKKNKAKILKLIGFEHYSEIFNSNLALNNFKRKSLKRDSLEKLKIDFKNFIAKKIVNIMKSKKYDMLNIHKLKKFPEFRDLTIKIISDLRNELESCKIRKISKFRYDVSELEKNYYGKKILKDSNIEIIEKEIANKKQFLIKSGDIGKIRERLSYLKLNVEIID